MEHTGFANNHTTLVEHTFRKLFNSKSLILLIPYRRFAVEQLKPGDKACCAYTNSDCVKNNDPNDPVWFSVRISMMALNSLLLI